jgi:hypothetical protein
MSTIPPISDTLPGIVIALSASDRLSAAVGAVLDVLDLGWALEAAPYIALLRGNSSRRDPLQPAAHRLLIERLSTLAPTVPVRVVPRPTARDFFGFAGDQPAWIEIDLGGRGERFDRIRLPSQLVRAGARCLVTALPNSANPARAGASGDRPIFALAAYADPRQALAARIDRATPGSQAELAAAIPCRLILLTGHHPDDRRRFLALATPDLIAAELCWLALRDDAPEQLGPWQDSTVQRATELDLGARLPSQLHLIVAPPTSSLDPALTALLERLRLRLGIP